MHSHTSPAAKLIVFIVMVSVVTLVSAQCPVNCRCSRYKTFCDLASLNTLPTLLPNTTQYVKIEADHIPEINSSIISHSRLHNLSRLDLINVYLQEIQPGAFQNMSQLEYLLITQNNIRVLKTNSFEYLQNLYFLNLSHNAIWNLESGTFSGLLKLKHLDLRYNYIYLLKASVFEGMRVTGNCDMRQVPIIHNTLEKSHIDEAISILCRNRDYNYINDIHCSKLLENPKNIQGDPEVLKYLCSLTYFAVDYQILFYHLINLSKLINFYTPLLDLDKSYIHIPYHMPSGFALRVSNLYTTILYKRSNFHSTGLFYLDLSGTKLSTLANGSFQNLEQLTYLDISYNDIQKIPNGVFQGLVSLKTLKIIKNSIKNLNNGAFTGLNSLKWLEMSSCNISTIENNAFKGLSKLQLLDLSDNPLYILKNNTFSGLHMLKHLMLDKFIIKSIDNNAFSHMTNLKTLSNVYYFHILKIETLTFKNFLTFYKLLSGSSMQMFKTPKETFLHLDRLDSLELTVHISLTKQMQVLKSLHLYIDATSVDPIQQLHDVLDSVYYVQELNVTLLGVNSTEFLTTLSEYKISSLSLLNNNLKVLHNNSLSGLPTSKTLLIFDKTYSIENRAFHELTSLTELMLTYESDLKFGEGSFYGLHSLKQLTIFNTNTEYWFLKERSECLHKRTFVGLNNLKMLELPRNAYTCLNPGAFQGLYNLEEISLNDNHIETINAGVFGAECKKEFKLSCKNVTLTEYCNSTNALTTLKYLNLAHNNITHIHPHAFIGCNNMHTLDLSENIFLTLDNSFLFTPGLRKLNMKNCSLDNIPNNTFECTPFLSHIDFSSNQILHLTLSTLLPLRHLQFIDIRKNILYCGCELYETWLWLHQHHVHYITRTYIYQPAPYCGVRDIDKVFSIMHCNKTLQHTTVRNNVTIRTDDFQLFKQYIEPLVLIIILISGLACNGFLLFISLYHKDMRKKQNALVIHLAIVDVLSLILHLPLSYWDTVNVIWEFDNTVCKIFILSKDMVVAVNVASVVALCIERFIVAKTFKNLKKFCVAKTIPTIWLIVMTWFCGILTSFPAYFSAAVVDARCLYCPPTYENYVRNAWTFQLIMYCLVPAVAIAFLNIKTSIFLRESIRKIPGEIKNNIKAKNRKIVANVVLILAVVFVISYLPSYVLRVLVAWSIVDMDKIFLPAFFTYCLFFCSTVFNPISLFIMSSKFKSYGLRHLPFLTNEQNT